jgi:hypothetical protein
VSIPESSLNRRPSFKLGLLTGEGRLATFLEAFDWVLGEIKKAEVEPVPPEAAPSEKSDDGAPA